MTTHTTEPTLDESIEKLIASGRFESKEDVLREGVRLIEAEDEQWAELDARIVRALDDADAGRVEDAEVVFERLVSKYKAMAQTV